MNTVSDGQLITFHFRMYSTSGDLLGETGETPLSYVHGQMQTEPVGLGEYLEGKAEGFSGRVTLPPEKAFGEPLPKAESVQKFPKSELGDQVSKGMMFMATVPGKGEIPMMVMDVQEEDVIVLLGHPLAGHHITFDVDIISVRTPTPEDLKTFAQST